MDVHAERRGGPVHSVAISSTAPPLGLCEMLVLRPKRKALGATARERGHAKQEFLVGRASCGRERLAPARDERRLLACVARLARD